MVIEEMQQYQTESKYIKVCEYFQGYTARDFIKRPSEIPLWVYAQ